MSGTCLLLRRECILEVGFFDDYSRRFGFLSFAPLQFDL
jgi:hypothetical protein